MVSSIFVVIPNWNGADFILSCLKSLETQLQKHEVIVVDNGSVDNSIALIENKFPNVNIIKLPHNTGFSGGVNAGIDFALQRGAEFIALLNNDAIVDKNWLSELIKPMHKTNVGITTGKILTIDRQSIDTTSEGYSIWGMPFPRGRSMSAETKKFEKTEEVFGASGGSSLYRSSLFEDIGIFDEDFFAYYEDVDLSFRAQLAGWKVVFNPSALTYHQISATSSRLGTFTRYHATKNFFMVYLKNMPVRLFIYYLPLFFAQSLILFISSLIKGRGLVYLRAFCKTTVTLPSILRKRHQIQRSRIVSVSYINSILYKHRPPYKKLADKPGGHEK